MSPASADEDAQRAWDALQLALDEVRPPCAGDDRWTSDDPDDLLEAADRCLDCPLMLACDEYATTADERHGCWGGVVRDPRHRQDVA